MQKYAKDAERTIAVLSPDYLDALYTRPEWAAAFAQDPDGKKGILIPVRVRKCDIEGLLKTIIYIDLVGLEEERAKEVLLKGMSRERAKPDEPPVFPGQVVSPVQYTVPGKPAFPVKEMGTGKLFEKFEEKQNIKPDKAIKVNPDDWVFLFQEGKNLAALGHHDEADKAFEKASEINPDAWAAWYQWGKTLGVLGRHDKALEANEKAKELKQKQDHLEKTSRKVLTNKGREKESE